MSDCLGNLARSFLQRSLLWWISLVFSSVHAANSEDPGRLGHAVEPLSQTLELTLDPEKDTYSGRTHVDLRLGEATRTFRFHATDLELDRGMVDVPAKLFPASSLG